MKRFASALISDMMDVVYKKDGIYMKTKPFDVILPRLFASWILVSFLNSFLSSNHLELSFIEVQQLPLFLLKGLLCFIALTLLNSTLSKHTDMIALLFGTMLYSFRVVSSSDNVFLLFGVCLFQLLILCFYEKELRQIFSSLQLKRGMFPAFSILAALLLFGFLFFTTACRYDLSRSSTFDMGIFVQMFHSMKEHGTMLTTCERNELLSHLQVHTSVFYYLLLPFYLLVPSGKTLLFLQAASIAIGIFPLLLLCNELKLTKKRTLVVSGIYLASPALSGGCFYDFHENVFLIPLLLFLFYFYEKRSKVGMLLFSLLVCSVKEDACLFLLVLGLFALFSDHRIKEGISFLLLGAFSMLLTFSYLARNGEGLMTNHYSNLVTGEGGLASIAKTLLVDPGYLFTQMFTEEKIPFLLVVFLPLAAFCFMTKKYSRMILLLPFLFINLLPDYTYQHSIFYQYVFAPYMFLLYLFLRNFAETTYHKAPVLLAFCLLCACYGGCSQILPKQYYIRDYFYATTERNALAHMRSCIPDQASVAASTFFVPQLANREEIYMLDASILNREQLYETDYVVFDLRNGFTDDSTHDQIARYQDAGYATVEENPSYYLVLKRKS